MQIVDFAHENGEGNNKPETDDERLLLTSSQWKIPRVKPFR